ncbi:hypothetical protein GCM10011368_02310 [Hyunsoonleella pacifica]|nr:hypothetical protein GCM10011368_02310 [Hyunsoonleella pacifica]
MNLTNEFVINNERTYPTPNGYFEEYISEGKVIWFALKLINGRFLSTSNSEALPCPYVENLNHGISIGLRLDHDKRLETGTYNYTISENNLGIIDNSEIFYGFNFLDDCFGTSETILKIVSGTLIVQKEAQNYNILYTLTSESGDIIKGHFSGNLIPRIIPEW